MTAATTRTGPRVARYRDVRPLPEELRELVRTGAELELAPGREPSSSGPPRRSATRFCITSSMGDAALVGPWPRKVVPGIDVVFLDTGYHFIETIGTRDAVASTLDAQPAHDHAGTERGRAGRGVRQGPLQARDPDLRCALRKVKPLTEALAEYDAWATGLRRAETHNRVIAPVVGWDAKKRKVKVSPLARWSDEQVERYIAENGVLVNPLTTTATRRSVARPAPVGSLRARMPAAAGGPAPTRPSAGSTHEPATHEHSAAQPE